MKDKSKSPETNLKKMDIYELTDKKYKIIMSKKLNVPQQNAGTNEMK